jgi:hypothetical protein
MGMLVTVGTDGFRDFVNLPDGRTFTLGSVSVLKFVTSLVSSGAIARKVLDAFLAKGEAKLSVDLTEMEDLLRPKRSRWAVHENRLIPVVSRPLPRGASTMNPFEFKLAALETLVAGITNASPTQVRALQQLAHGLSVDPIAKEGAVDEDAKTELELYMDNEGRLVSQKEGILKNILRKMKSGKYDHNLSPKLWMYWVDEGAKMYAKEFGGEAKTLFPKPLREALAKDIADHEKVLIEEGNYSHIKVADEGEIMASAPSAVLSFKAAGAESKESEEKESRFEEGKPADPTENMSKEDADEWKKQNDKNKDKFKSAAGEPEMEVPMPGGLDPAPKFGDAMVLEGLDEIMAAARKAQAAYTSGNTGKVFFSLLGVLNGLGRVGTAFDLPDIGYLIRVRKAFLTLSSGRPTTNFSASEEAKVEEDTFKTATLNEALATSVLTKVEAALQAVETSPRTNTKVATMDLHIISSKLAEMLQVKALTDDDLQPQLLDLASKAEKIQAHFGAAKQSLIQDGKGST